MEAKNLTNLLLLMLLVLLLWLMLLLLLMLLFSCCCFCCCLEGVNVQESQTGGSIKRDCRKMAK
jgi:hypothetical protein